MLFIEKLISRKKRIEIRLKIKYIQGTIKYYFDIFKKLVKKIFSKQTLIYLLVVLLLISVGYNYATLKERAIKENIERIEKINNEINSIGDKIKEKEKEIKMLKEEIKKKEEEKESIFIEFKKRFDSSLKDEIKKIQEEPKQISLVKLSYAKEEPKQIKEVKKEAKKTEKKVIEKKEVVKQPKIIKKETKKEVKKETNPYLLKMNLTGCRITQGEKSHLKKGNGSMYAIDIACIRGKKFDVKAPKFKPYYILEKRGYDDKLGNYLVLRHGKNRYVFGHTTSSLEEGTKVVNNQVIGQTNISGISTNYHLHFELWEEDKNISWKNEVAPKSEKIVIQRGWYKNIMKDYLKTKEEKELKEITDFIKKFEDLELEAYCDNLIQKGDKWIKHCPTGKERFSIGYGTKSYKGEKISEKEAYNRLLKYVKNDYPLVNNGCYTLNQKKAILSYMYNTGGNQMNFKNYVKKCSIKDIRYIMSVWGNKSSHKERRDKEKELLGK